MTVKLVLAENTSASIDLIWDEKKEMVNDIDVANIINSLFLNTMKKFTSNIIPTDIEFQPLQSSTCLD